MQKILVIPSWYPPDGGQFFQDHAEALAEAGFQVDVLVNRFIGITRLKFSELSTLKRFNVREVNGTRVIRSFYLKWPRLELLNIGKWANSTEKMYRRYRDRFGSPDIILAHSSLWAGYAASRIAARHGIPYIITEHRSRFTGKTARAESLVKRDYFPLLKEAFQAAGRIVTVSDALHPSISHFASEDQEIRTIPNLVDAEFFLPPGNRMRDPYVILSIGRLEQEKGMDLLIDAFDRLIKEIPEASLRIVGKGPRESQLKSMASGVEGGKGIHFLGKLTPSQLLIELQQAKVLAVPSRFEAFGVVFIEAMSTGLPVLAARSGGPETFVPEMAGKVVENDSAPAVFTGLKEIYDGYETYDRLKIRKYAEKHFSRKAVMKQYAKLIPEVCRENDRMKDES